MKALESQRFTPYMHILTDHYHEFIKIHGSVNNFNIQGLEKLNNLTTQEVMGASNKRPHVYVGDDNEGDDETKIDKCFLQQVLEGRNRKEEASFEID